MSDLIICIIIVAVIFVLSYATKRRFGLLGLALAAGSILSNVWAYEAGLIAGALGFPLSPLTSTIILAIITLLPACLLLSRAKTYKTGLGRLVGAALFTVVAAAFLVEPFSRIFILKGSAGQFYQQLLGYKDLIIGVGLIVAVLDLFFAKKAESSEKKHEH